MRKFGPVALLPIGAALVAFYSSCGVERPGIGDEQFSQPKFAHDGHTDACATCHEEDRKDEADGSTHGGGKDCVACHKPSDVNAGWLPATPYTHSPPPATCLPCHTNQRPQRQSHPQTGDCHSCHRFPSWAPI